MIQNIIPEGVHVELEDEVKDYAVNKLGRLDKYLPRNIREVAKADLRLRKQPLKNKDSYICELELRLPKQSLLISKRAVSFYAAIDRVEEDMKLKISKYKETHYDAHKRRHDSSRKSPQ
jgi:ribosomal subunit interface protein